MSFGGLRWKEAHERYRNVRFRYEEPGGGCTFLDKVCLREREKKKREETKFANGDRDVSMLIRPLTRKNEEE